MLTAVILAVLTLQAQPPVRVLPPTTMPQAAQEKPWPPPGITRVTGEIVPPRATYEVRPRYTSEAMKAGVSGAVLLEAVVDAKGQVGEVRVTRSLDREFGLDDRAVIYIRHGEPARRTLTMGSAIESWTYEVDGASVTVHFAEALFDGASGNGTLIAVPPLGSFPAVCLVDDAYCRIGSRSGVVPPEQLERIRQSQA